MAYHHMGTFVIKEEVSEESLDEMFQKVEELFATVDSATNVMVGRNLNPSAKYRMFGICTTFPNQDAWLALVVIRYTEKWPTWFFQTLQSTGICNWRLDWSSHLSLSAS